MSEENTNTSSSWGCLTTILVIALIGWIGSSMQTCSNNHHRHYDIVLPTYSSFVKKGDPEVIFQTFGRQGFACLNYRWASGTSAAMYVHIKDGNNLYDADGTLVGYIKPHKDGSFDIKYRGESSGKGHYEGVKGSKIMVKQ